jgi:hypothetical protein
MQGRRAIYGFGVDIGSFPYQTANGGYILGLGGIDEANWPRLRGRR